MIRFLDLYFAFQYVGRVQSLDALVKEFAIILVGFVVVQNLNGGSELEG